MSGARLNMKHGFISYIQRNQVNRDKYDKEVKAKAAAQAQHSRQPPGSNRVKKPDQQTYVPPTRLRQATNGEAKMPEEDVSGEVLFRLDYEDQNGDLHNIYIHPNDDPVLLSRHFGHDQGFTYPMVRAFTDFVRDEMKKCENK